MAVLEAGGIHLLEKSLNAAASISLDQDQGEGARRSCHVIQKLLAAEPGCRVRSIREGAFQIPVLALSSCANPCSILGVASKVMEDMLHKQPPPLAAAVAVAAGEESTSAACGRASPVGEADVLAMFAVIQTTVEKVGLETPLLHLASVALTDAERRKACLESRIPFEFLLFACEITMTTPYARFLTELLRLLFDCGWYRTERSVPGCLHALKVLHA